MTTTTLVSSRNSIRVAELFQSWRYAGGKRDLRLDLLRGIAVFAMIVDHIGGWNSWLNPVTGANLFVVSAAEPFVFISGLVMGIVYLNVATTQGAAAAAMKAFHRAWSLYLVTVLVTLALGAVGTALALGWAPDMSNGGVRRFVLDVVTLHRAGFLTDVLLLYVLLVVAAGPAVLLLSRGYTWIILAGSWSVWAVWQLSPDSVAVPWTIQGNSVFHFASWQVLFFNGLVIGWHRAKIEAWVKRLPKMVLFGVLAAVAAVAIGGHVSQAMHMSALPERGLLYDLAFDKPNVPIGRVLHFVLLMVAGVTLATLFWGPIRRAGGWLLIPLGQSALTAYVLHLFLIALVTKLNAGDVGRLASGRVGATALQIGGLMAIWLLVVLWPRFKWGLQRWVLAPSLPKFKLAYAPIARQTRLWWVRREP